MLGKFLTIVKSKMLCAAASPAVQSFLFPKNLILDQTTSVNAQGTIFDLVFQLVDFFGELINTFFYIIAKYILLFIDVCQVIVYKLAGIDNDLTQILQMPIFRFILNETVLTVFGAVFILGLVILIVATIIAIVKSEYEASLEDKKDAKVMSYKAVGKAATTLFVMVITPFLIIISIVFSSVLLTSMNNVLNPNGTQNATLGGQLFASSAYHANKYRTYAEKGQRLPILFEFEDPYSIGTYEDYTSEELAKIYASWDGRHYYNQIASGEFMGFASTIEYNDNKIYNSSTYKEFERFIATQEQYYIMADFIDYAMAHDMTFYIKDASDHEVDWDSTVPTGVKLSDTVYDKVNQTLTITYTDVSGISPYDDYYTVTFEMGSASATTPISDAVRTLSLIMGLFNVDEYSTEEIANGALTNSALVETGNAISDVIKSSLAVTDVRSGINFRLLERVEGSTNIVKWQTEKAIFGNQEFTVYELKKITKNTQTGINETRATVKVAKKDDSLDSKYYILNETPADTGYYTYTNVTIDYYNDGSIYLDTLEPVYKYATWPDKLYNDLHVIYSDIDFDNYINYDNWADALGEYFNANSGTSDAEVSTFATTLVHPLGLIMAEMFMNVTMDKVNTQTEGDFGFTTSYLKDAIESIVLSVGGQFDYENIMCQIDYFVQLFNAQFASVIESLKNIENFDIDGKDETSVQCYVYKAYLSSIMLSTEYSDYLIKMAETVLNAQRLVEVMSYGSSSVVTDENGQTIEEVKFVVDQDGVRPKITYANSGDGKEVFTKYGKRVAVCDEYGKVVSNSTYTDHFDPLNLIYVPRESVSVNGQSQKIKFRIEDKTKHQEKGAGLLNLSPYEEVYSCYYVYSPFQHKYISAESLQINNLIKEAGMTPETIAENFPGYNDYNEKDVFETYFEPFYEYSNHYIYVYEPVDGYTMDETAKVQRNNVIVVEKNNPKLEDFKELLDSYYLYETQKDIIYVNDYLTYDNLPELYKDVLDDVIEDMEADFESGYIEEPAYFKFLKDYQENKEGMGQVMAAETIDSQLAKKYLQDYNSMLSSIEMYEDKIENATGIENLLAYETKLEELKQKVNQTQKYYITYAIESYVSTKISSDFTVIVNGHPYNVSQGITQRNLMEIVLGNHLNYEGLINALNNGQTYANLSEFNKNAIKTFRAFVEVYTNKIKNLLTTDASGEYLLFSGRQDDSSLDLASRLYTAKTGVYLELTNKKIASLSESEKESIVQVLTLFCKDIKIIYNNYISGKTILSEGTNYAYDLDEPYAIMAAMIRYNMKDETLRYVDDDYTGFVDAKGEGFGLLKDFLSKFGNICFDLSRKTNISSIGKEDKNNFLDYVTDFAKGLNERLKDVDFGHDTEEIVTVTDNTALKQNNNTGVDGSAYFKNLNTESKMYIYQIYKLFSKQVNNYLEELDGYKNNYEYAARYTKNRYAMYADSFVYTSGLKEYLNYFRYNTDINDEEFKDKFVYEGFTGSLETEEDRIFYYNLYLEAFEGTLVGKNGVYFEDLSDLQKKVLVDMTSYYKTKYDNFVKENEEKYLENKYNEQLFYNFIYAGKSLNDAPLGIEINAKVKSTIIQIFNDNVNLLNLYNMLTYVGLEFDVGNSLQDYRLEALNMLVDFKERAGESGASIQSRYLALLYIFCADYSTNIAGNVVVETSLSTKNAILKLAGIENKAEELLVGLEYEVDFSEASSDEAFGDVFVICTKSAETGLYEPFVFATGADKYGTPISDYYASTDGSICYYPIIAKGVIDPSGRPTAIREVNGFIEFYRENVVVLDAGQLDLKMYYTSAEEVQLNYNPINILVNKFTKFITGKTLAQHILEAFPIIEASNSMGFAYGSQEAPVYYLDNGAFCINYMFYEDSGIAFNCLYDVGELNIIILTLGTLIIAVSLIKALWGLIRNIYEILILTLIYPGVFGLNPLMDKPQAQWRKQFISKMLVMFGFIISINAFFIIVSILNNMDVKLLLSEESREFLKSTFLFGKFNLDSVVNLLVEVAMFLVACTLLNTLPKMFSKMAGGDDAISKGQNTVSAVKYNIQTAEYFASGYMMEDVIASKTAGLKKLPLVGTNAIHARRDKKKLAANAAAVKAYSNNLRAMGIADDVIEKAAKAYADSLDRQLEEERMRRNANAEARAARLERHAQRTAKESARSEKEHKSKAKDPWQCDYCKTMNHYKNKNCSMCGRPK